MNCLPHRIKNDTIVINHDPRVMQTIPHARGVQHGDKSFLLVPLKATEVKLLNNLGYSVPAPIRSRYDWCGHTPFAHQVDTAALLTTSNRAYVLSSMGVGKTLAAMFAFDYLLKIGEIQRVLVVCPLSVVSGVWESELFRWMPHLRTAILHGTKAQRLKALSSDADVYIINHDGVHTILDALMKKNFNFVLIDELSAYRNARTRRWRALKKLTDPVQYVHGMTGTPMVKAPTDAFGQAKLITPENVTQYFKAFQNQTMYQVSQFTWRPRQDALDTVYKTLQPAIRVTLDDCSDIPQTVYTTREVEMTPDQKKVYKKMRDEYHALHDGKEINAVNAGVRMGKLLQVAAGAVYTEDGGVTYLENTDRLQAVDELIRGAEGKAIVFVPYRHQLAYLQAELSGSYGVDVIHGGISKRERDQIFTEFKGAQKTPQVLIAVPGTMSHGLSLTVATTIIWWAPITNLETYLQANARITRADQDKHTIIAHIEASPIEKKVYKVLQTRGNLQAALLNMYQEEIE